VHKTMINESVALQPPLDVEGSMKNFPIRIPGTRRQLASELMAILPQIRTLLRAKRAA